MAELVPMKLKKEAGKCTLIETEVVSKTNKTLSITIWFTTKKK